MSRISSRQVAVGLCAVALTMGGTSRLRAAGEDAGDPKPKASAPKAAPAKAKPLNEVPLERVVMFNSGVGFFEHRGEIQGDGAIDLKFNVEDINDLLKSMVLQDLGGGRISTVTYGSRDPITKALKTFAVNLTDNPTLGQILTQLRGERVEISAPNAITGVILGVETRKREVGKDHQAVDVEMLNLLTEVGLRSVALESVGSIRLLDEKLNTEFRQALKVLALGHDTDKKTVTLNFLGEGKRPVRVGYIQETPVWKTSYRLVLKDEEQPFLQGWAIVENTTENDWNKIALTLISGRPISFIMDLYQPLYVSRPVVEPELYASLRPQTYGQDMAGRDRDFRKQAEGKDGAAVPAPGFAGRRGVGREERAAGAAKPAQDFLARDKADEQVALNLAQGVQSLSQAGNVGEMFQYAIATPVTLPRQQSAMLPIVNESVKGEKLSIYNQAVQPKHPLNGLRLINSTDLHLMQGPITVFDGGAYAGDAKIADLQPGTERLISYALDLDTEVAPETQGHPEQLLSVSLVKGVLHASRKYTQTHKYTVKNSGKKAKKVLIEYRFDANWKLVTPKEPSEKTRDLYRFAVTAEPGKPAVLEVAEERTDSQSWALTNLDDNTIVFYINQPVTNQKVKDALAEVIKRKQQLAKVLQDRQQLEQQITIINQEQDRIRQNMAQLDRNTDLYKRYVTKFGAQEDQVEKHRERIRALVDEEAGLRKALDTYLIGLDLS